ncbi:MAG: aminoacyl-tRNA hydrolase [Bdellovibrionales bacterium]
MKLIIGLGNPGGRYQNNRHNVGFMAAGEILRRHSFAGPSEKFHSHVWQGTLGGMKTLLLMPQTYMNESGRAVEAAMSFYKIDPEDLIVLHDEIDLPIGTMRIKKGGGSAGQNGIKDIDSRVGPEFWRVRIGVGHPRERGLPMDVADYVLSDFTRDERVVIDAIIDEIAMNAPLLFSSQIMDLQNKVALRTQPLLKTSND